VIQVRNQIVQKWIVQRNSPILFWRFRGVIGSGSLSTACRNRYLGEMLTDKTVLCKICYATTKAMIN